MNDNSTVYDRMQKNGGFVTGPNHMFSKGNDSSDPDGDGDVDAVAPPPEVPNYREADTPGEFCKSCVHFEEDSGECGKYEFRTKPTMVCDDFQPGMQEQGADDGSEMDPSEMDRSSSGLTA